MRSRLAITFVVLAGGCMPGAGALDAGADPIDADPLDGGAADSPLVLDAPIVPVDADIDAPIALDGAALPDAPPDAGPRDAARGDAGPYRPLVSGPLRVLHTGARWPHFLPTGAPLTLFWQHTIAGAPRIVQVDATGATTSTVSVGAIPGIGVPTHLWGLDVDATGYGAIADADPRIGGHMGASSGRIALDGTPAATWTPRPAMELAYELVALAASDRWATARLRGPGAWGTTYPYVASDLAVFDGALVPTGPALLEAEATSASIGRNGDAALTVSMGAFEECRARAVLPTGALAAEVIPFECGNTSVTIVPHGVRYAVGSSPPYGPIEVALVDPATATAGPYASIPYSGAIVSGLAVAGDAAETQLAVAYAFATTDTTRDHEVWLQELDPTTLAPLGVPLLLLDVPDGDHVQGITAAWTDAGLLVVWAQGPIDGPLTTFIELLTRS